MTVKEGVNGDKAGVLRSYVDAEATSALHGNICQNERIRCMAWPTVRSKSWWLALRVLVRDESRWEGEALVWYGV